MVRAEERGLDSQGWNIRAIYEGEQSDLLETEAFFMAFSRMHNLDGHKVMCVLAPVKNEALKSSYEHEGVFSTHSVLIVSSDEVQGMKVNDSLRVDGGLYVIAGVSRPSGDIVRIVLEGAE